MTAVVREQRLAGLRWIVVGGGRREVFRALGETAREDIRAVQEAMPERDALRRWVSTAEGGARLQQVLQATRTRYAAEVAELEALAEGAGADVDDLLLANLRGDLGTDDGTGCTDLAWRRSRSFVAHNEDGAPALDGRLMLLTLVIDGLPPVTVQWYPGFLPANTFTATGLGLVWGINHVQVVRPSPAGAGRHFVARALQCAPTLDAAAEHLRTHPSAGGFAYTIGERGSGRVAVVESAAGRVAAVEATAEEPLHWHANHLRHLRDAPDVPPAPRPGCESGHATADLGQYEESLSRGRALEKMHLGPREPSGDWFLEALTSAPLPHGVHRTAAGPDPLMTLCTVVADLTGDRLTVRGASGETAVLPLTDFSRGIATSARAI
ncbi:C45 family peptidase [Streptomyces sp. NPDC047108]|uniref:C45 family peptidase n=1 Tax=Streptomyces sp. NPDC047108 TaxID=3155025 RepID=UPI0033D95576